VINRPLKSGLPVFQLIGHKAGGALCRGLALSGQPVERRKTLVCRCGPARAIRRKRVGARCVHAING